MAAVPPIDTNGEVDAASKVLKRCRKELATLPDEWQWWVAESLMKGLPPIEDDVVS